MSQQQRKPLPYFGSPPPREPRPASSEPTLQGKRVILSTPEGFVYDMRAVSQVHTDREGHQVVDIATEEDYFRWMFSRTPPPRQPFPVSLVWVE